MLSTSNLKSGQADSYFEQDDYYSKEEGPGESRWLGEGAKKLGLEGGVSKEDFSQVLKGKSPSGELLFSREVDQKKRRAATDFTFSAPKSVSVAGLVQGDERVIEAHHLAVERTLAILEKRYAETRVMTATGRKKIGTGNIVAAVFAHGTSREAEPQLHSHCVVMNATQVENGRWYSLLNDSAIANKKLLGQIYQNELAVELQQLGYEIVQREYGQFDIKGYSQELLDTFSTRRGQIEALVEEWKESGKVVRDADGHPVSNERLIYEAATLKTRKAKPQIIAAGELLQNWKSVLAMKGLTLPELPSAQFGVEGIGETGNKRAAETVDTSASVEVGQGEDLQAQAVADQVPTSPEKPKKLKKNNIIDDAIAHCGERDAIFEPKQIEKFVFENNIGAASIAHLEQEVKEHPEIISLGLNQKKKPIVTTNTALQLELQTIRLMQQGQGKVLPFVLGEAVHDSFVGSSLSEEQRQAIANSCAATDRVIAWQGSAGAGKTYGLKAFKQLAEEAGYTVSGYAPSSAAAHELGESLEIQTETVARLLMSEPLAEVAAQKQLWLVDEAGLLSMNNAQQLLSQAQAQDARVVLVGDTKQLSAVEAGNPFKSLQAGGMQTFHLDETRRQKKEALRQVVQLVSAGEVRKSIDVLTVSGYLTEIEEEQPRIAQVAKDFLELSQAERSETLVLAETNENRLRLTQEIRRGLQRDRSLGADVFTMKSLQRKDLTRVEAQYARQYEQGDIIVPIRDYKRQRLERNLRYMVQTVDAAANRLVLETPEGKLIQVNPRDCGRKAVYTVLAEPVAIGDRLKWTKNDRVEKTRNGQHFTVLAISESGLAQTVDDDGRSRALDLSGYQHVDYSWIATTYSSQGKTAERVLALVDKATVNKESFYVATSRAKNDLRLYTADIQGLRDQAAESKANKNVSDYLPSLFELAQHEQSQTTADYAREVARNAGRSVDARQQAATRSSQSEQSTDSGVGSGAAEYVTEFVGVPQRVEAHARWVKRQGQIVRVGDAASAVDASAEQIQRLAGDSERIAGAAARLNRDVEHTTRSRQSGARKPKLRNRSAVEKPRLKSRGGELSTEAPMPLTADRQNSNESVDQLRQGDALRPLFEVVAAQSSKRTADLSKEIVEGAGQSLDARQRAQSDRQKQTSVSEVELGSSQYVAAFAGLPERVEAQTRWVKRQGKIVQVEAALSHGTGAEQIQQRADIRDQVTAAAVQLNQAVEQATLGRLSRPKLKRKETVDVVQDQALVADVNNTAAEAAPAPAQIYAPVELKPPSPNTSLKQQLDDLAQVLGYAPGDRLYVRALLPKNLSDDLAVKKNLKFEIEENGKKRLILNTRRGYLTVGSWAFTHVRKNKEPAVYEDGLAKLTELNQEGRGIYFVVNPGGENDATISEARSVFWENDNKTKAEQIDQAQTSGLPLGAVIETNKSIHCYSPLSAPITDMDEWKKLQERLIQRMASDPAIRNSSRLMRLPGFAHVRVGSAGQNDEHLIFTPVTLRHIDKEAHCSVETLAENLPIWDKERWDKETGKGRTGSTRRTGKAALPKAAAENPWDIRNFSQYLNGDHYSQNGWLQVQCPHHGGEGSSGTSLGINEATGQFTCHSGCDSKDVYRAAWDLAAERGWSPPQREAANPKKVAAVMTDTDALPTAQNVVLGDESLHQKRWRKYSKGVVSAPGKAMDLQVARRAISDGLAKSAVIELLAQYSPVSKKLYQEKGSTPAYNYVSSIITAAIQQRKEQRRKKRRSNDIQR